MFELFSEGGPWGMSLLTVELICLLFAAWKAPAWVKEIGLLAPVTAFVYMPVSYTHLRGFRRRIRPGRGGRGRGGERPRGVADDPPQRPLGPAQGLSLIHI